MDLIVQWVMQIVVFILIATIIELITPENMMKKYVNLVVGLILILIFAQPLLYFLNIDMKTKLTEVESNIFDHGESLNLSQSLLERQKEDIQAEQDAYILTKVEEQLIHEANPILYEQHNVIIHNIEFTFSDQQLDKYDDLDSVTVFVKHHDESNRSDINPVVIEFEDPDVTTKNKQKQTKKIETLLKDIWDLHDKNVSVKWEGGTSD